MKKSSIENGVGVDKMINSCKLLYSLLTKMFSLNPTIIVAYLCLASFER